MEKQHLIMYLHEIKSQCTFAKMSYSLIDGKLNDSDEFWFGIQSYLAAVGNLSKLLFGFSRDNPRAITLRSKLDISDSSLLKSRDLRNHFEHYDERLDRWIASTEDGNYIDRAIGQKELFNFGSTIIQRMFDPKTYILSYQDEEYNLAAVHKEVMTLSAKADQVFIELLMMTRDQPFPYQD